MGKQTKQTRKFAPKLKKVIERRREFQKTRDKYKKTGASEDGDRKPQKKQVAEEHSDSEENNKILKKAKAAKSDDELAGLNADEFLDEGFFDEVGDEEDGADQESDVEDDEAEDANEIESHKQQLEELKNTQPEFYEFLQKEGSDLLDFGDSDEDDGEDEDEDGDGGARGFVITKDTFDKWVQIAIKLKSPKALKKVVSAFRAACHMNDEVDEDTVTMKKQYKILDSGVFNHLIVGCMKNMGEILDALINRDKSTETDTKKFYPAKYPRWRKLGGIVKVYLTNLLHFINQLSDPKMLGFILKQIETQLPYFGPFAKLSKNLLKKMLDLWGSASETVRILAFINIRRMALDFPYPFIGMCLKGIYLTYVRNAKFTNPKTLPLINFMSNCVTEIYGLDWTLSYQHMFVYIRQMAIILRASFNTKSKDSYDGVYNWQFINSIRAWVRVFSAYPNQPVLQLLVHPLVQIIQGVISLVPTARYYPLRFQCVRMMNEIALFNTNLYINALPFLLEVLNSPEMTKKGKPSMQKQTEMASQLKIANKMLGTKVYQDMVIKECIDLIEDYLSIYAYSISFPELSIPATINLKRYLKQCKVPFFRKRVSTIIDEVNNNAKYIQAKRMKLNMNPSDVVKNKVFLKEECENHMGLTPLMKHRIKLQQILSGKVELNQKHIDEYNANYRRDSAEESDDENGDADQADSDAMDGEDADEEEDKPAPKQNKSKPNKQAQQEKKQKQKEQHAQNNGEDIVEDMDLADFEASDDDMSDE